MKKCINCGIELQNGDMFCRECGTKQEVKKQFCGNCGAQVPAGSKFCMECGTPVPVPVVATKPEPRAVAVEPKAAETPKTSVTQPDENTIALSFKGIPFELKLVLGRDYGTEGEISDFYIGKMPVTQILWFAVTDSNPSSNSGNPNFPVTNVTASMATSFMVKLKKEFGVKFELPTAEQWDYAYSGGYKSKGFQFSGSNDLDEVGWTDEKMHPVGELFENELGLTDMEGLVEELQKDDRKSVYSSAQGEYLNDADFTGMRFIVNIPKEGFPANSLLADFVAKIQPAIDAHHSKELERMKLEAKEEEAKRKAKEEEAKRKAEIDSEKEWTWKKKKEGNKFGLVDALGNWRIEPVFDRLIGNWGNPPYFYDGLCAAGIDGKLGFIDRNGKWAIKPIYDDVGCSYKTAPFFKNGFCAVKLNGKWGYIDVKGKWLTQPIFDDIKDWSESYDTGAAAKGDDWGPVDRNGKWKKAENQAEFILDRFL